MDAPKQFAYIKESKRHFNWNGVSFRYATTLGAYNFAFAALCSANGKAVKPYFKGMSSAYSLDLLRRDNLHS